jgi:hypothetical protein
MYITFIKQTDYNRRSYSAGASLNVPDATGREFIKTGYAIENVAMSIQSATVNRSAEFVVLQNIEDTLEALQELTACLATLASAMSSGAPALRVMPIGSVSTAVTGTLAVSSIANFGTGIPAKETVDDMNNMVVTLANIQNVTA